MGGVYFTPFMKLIDLHKETNEKEMNLDNTQFVYKKLSFWVSSQLLTDLP